MMMNKTEIYDAINIYDVDDLLEEIENEKHVRIENDPSISMCNGGHTDFWKTENEYRMFSEGQNWNDQEETIISLDTLKRLLQQAIENVAADFEKYEYDTEDRTICAISIYEPQTEEFY